jgi:hypothetical protein
MLIIFEIILSCTLYNLAIMCKEFPLHKQSKTITTFIYTEITDFMGHCKVYWHIFSITKKFCKGVVIASFIVLQIYFNLI